MALVRKARGQGDCRQGSIGSREETTGELNPKFANTTAGAVDLHLQAGSPMINAGTTISTLTRDISGVLRPQGTAYALGAYEYFTGGTGTPATCDLNGDGVVNSADVTIAVDEAIGIGGLSNVTLDGGATWNVIDVQRVVNAADGQVCRVGP